MGGSRFKRLPNPSPTVWKGPLEDGITQSLLSLFIVCRERFRLLVIKGLRPPEEFASYICFGEMWHTCEECHAGNIPWELPLRQFAIRQAQIHRTEGDQIEKWYNICRRQFPIYLLYWASHDHAKYRKPLLEEDVFAVPYTLPSGRKVLLRGKRDSVDIVKNEIWLQENKTKGDFDPAKLAAELPMNLQSMMYQVALREELDKLGTIGGEEIPDRAKIAGTRYNVVRRPLSGWGKFNIKQLKGRKTKKGIVGAETRHQFYNRLQKLIEDNVEHFFMRFNVHIWDSDIERFKRETFHPLLESLCDWWEWISTDLDNPYRQEYDTGKAANGVHYRTPFGLFNPILEGRMDAYYEYLTTGNDRNLEKTKVLFPEL